MCEEVDRERMGGTSKLLGRDWGRGRGGRHGGRVDRKKVNVKSGTPRRSLWAGTVMVDLSSRSSSYYHRTVKTWGLQTVYHPQVVYTQLSYLSREKLIGH